MLNVKIKKSLFLSIIACFLLLLVACGGEVVTPTYNVNFTVDGVVVSTSTFDEGANLKFPTDPVKEEKQEEKQVASVVAATEETVAAKEELKTETAAQPLEIDIAQLFDIKLSSAGTAPKKGRAPKKDPMPAATKAVAASLSKDDEDDDILKALDMYFEFKGPKSIMEISDEETDEDTQE